MRTERAEDAGWLDSVWDEQHHHAVATPEMFRESEAYATDGFSSAMGQEADQARHTVTAKVKGLVRALRAISHELEPQVQLVSQAARRRMESA
jgi:hypothetical protein